MDMKEYYKKAMSYEEYVAQLGEHCALHQLHYNKFSVSPDEEARIKAVQPVKILVLTEPWCGDSLAVFPVVRKMTELNGAWETRVLLRDQNLDLMDQFLTRGGRAVPLFFFIGEDDRLIFKFGPRPKASQQIFEDHRQLIQEGKIEKMEVIKKIRNFYAKDRGKAIAAELLGLLETHGML